MAAMALGSVVDTIRRPVFHIVEQAGAIDEITELDSPTEYYYDELRKDLEKRYPKVDKHFMDHMISSEAFMHRSIASGFSFGAEKAQLAVTEGKLLGTIVSREGMKPDPERVQAIVDFPVLKEKVHVQQFLGCTNWLRWFCLLSMRKQQRF